MVNTCILYGVTNWVNINILVVLVTFTLFALLYALGTVFPGATRERIKAAARSELTQGLISIVIIVVLSTVALTACSISSSMSRSLTKQGMNPFQYSEYFVGNLSTNTGLSLLTNLYSTSVSYAIEAQVLSTTGEILNNTLGTSLAAFKNGYGFTGGVLNIGISSVIELNVIFQKLSTVYLLLFSGIVTFVIGLLFIQFLALPVLEYTAFSVILPVAILMRSLPFMGTSLKGASNTVLAIAIAGYIIYPLMVSFNGYVTAWIFSSANPSAQYIGSTYVVPNIPVNKFFTTVQNAPDCTLCVAFSTLVGSNFLTPLWSSSFSSTGIITPYDVVSNAQDMVNRLSQFFFEGVVLFAMDLAVTVGFASGLSKALNSGFEGLGSFWSGI